MVNAAPSCAMRLQWNTMVARVAPVVLAWALFAGAVATSGAGWFDDQRGETLIKGLLAVALLMAAAAVATAVLWVISALRARGQWLFAAALVLAAPVDVVAPAPDFSARVAVVPLLDAVQITAGVTDRPSFAYHHATVFPSGDGWVLPHWPMLQVVLVAAIVLVIVCAWRAGVRERLLRLVFIGSARNS
jgi:hypothetical protein